MNVMGQCILVSIKDQKLICIETEKEAIHGFLNQVSARLENLESLGSHLDSSETEFAPALQVLLSQSHFSKHYPISTAKNGAGEQSGSEQTPRGLHIIRAKIGGDKPAYSVFSGRRFTGEIYDSNLAEAHPDRDWVLSRIMWLSGCEPGKNRLGKVDSMQRYIYIHGTPDTEPMGVPKSHGCIRMRNDEVVELFDWVKDYCPVYILESSFAK